MTALPPLAPNDADAQAELIFGLVGPVGVEIDEVTRSLARSLTQFRYRMCPLRLTALLTQLDWDRHLPSAPLDERIAEHMTAGNELRAAWERDDAFALLAIHAIQVARAELSGTKTRPAGRVAYVLRSLKRPEEAQLLRRVYGDRFVLLSLHAPEEARRERLDRQISESRVYPSDPTPAHPTKVLLDRDQKEQDSHGQDVRGLFHDGDFFIDVTRDLDPQIDRTLDVLFGHPHRTPTPDEQGMYFADAASLRSAELGRQVGAALCTHDGSVVATGTNEVPKAGGGLYWAGDDPDVREFTFGRDTSDQRKADIGRDLADRLVEAGLVATDASPEQIAAVVAASSVDDLIEFVRAVHAEMAVLTDAARRGVVTARATLYVTTFPCHHCARHVVAAGVERVVYVAPYAKSLAEDLHGDALAVDPQDGASCDEKVPFVPFVGVGPRRYPDAFRMPKRKEDSGTVVEFVRATASLRLRSVEPADLVPEPEHLPYLRRELRALTILASVMKTRAPRFLGFNLHAGVG